MSRAASTSHTAGSDTVDESRLIRELIERIVAECPRRLAGTESERRAHGIVRAALEEAGLRTALEPFRTADSLYASMALHFGVGLAGSLLFGAAPILALGLHTLAGASYLGESSKRLDLLRRLLPQVESQNLLATLPADGEPALRVVLVAHVDAAFTGLVFDPRVVGRTAAHRGPRLLRKPMQVATVSQLGLAALDVLGIVLGARRRWLWPAVGLLSVPALLTFALNLDVVLRDEVVPGANDNLTGCAALAVLARRLAPRKPREVELVFVATGAEEAGTCGARALVQAKRDAWDPAKTVIVGIDGLSNGELRTFVEGEVLPLPVAPWLRDVLAETSASSPRFEGVRGFDIAAGATDVAPFLAAGYDGVCVGCADPEMGTPVHYHLPTDTPENLDYEQILLAIDYVEALTDAIVRDRLRTTR